MKGLFISDLLWLKKQKRLWIIFALLLILYLVMDMGGFCVAFSGIFLSFLLQKSLAFYLGGHTAPFYLTLPFTRRQFVLEKYLVCIALPAMVMAVMLLVNMLAALAAGQSPQDLVISAAVSLVLIIVIGCVMIPLTIRFHDNASLYLMSLAGMTGIILAAIGFEDMSPETLAALPLSVFLGQPGVFLTISGLVLFLLLLLYGSCRLSLHWLNRSF